MQPRLLLAFCLFLAMSSPLLAQKTYTDYQPEYRSLSQEYALEKIEYKSDEIVFFLRLFIPYRHYTSIIFYPKKSENAWLLKDAENGDIYELRSIKNVYKEGELLATEINKESSFEVTDNKTNKSNEVVIFNFEVHFPMPKDAKKLHLIEGAGNENNLSNFNLFNIVLKPANSKDLGNAQAAQKRLDEIKNSFYSVPEKPKPLKITKETLLTEAIYRKEYQALKFQCETPKSAPYTFSLRENLFSTALFNDLCKKFDLGFALQTEIGFSGDEIAQIEVVLKGERFGFYNCNQSGIPDTIVTFDPVTFAEIATVQPGKTPASPAVNGFMTLDLTSRLQQKLEYKIYSFGDKRTEDWDLLIAHITPDAENRTIFIAQKADNQFILRKVNAKKQTATETVFALDSGKKTAEGELEIIPEKREIINTYDPDTFQDIQQEVITGESFRRKGSWKFYAPDGKLLKEEKY